MDPARRVNYADRGSSRYDLILAAFCVVLVVSNIVATKGIELGSGDISVGPIQIWPIITDGGAVLFPIAYVLGDVISEVYGFAAARRAIWMGFAMAALASLTFLIVEHAPAAGFYEHQDAFASVLGFVPRIVLASLVGYVVGQLLNSLVLVQMKARNAERKLWRRLAGSTGVGELADTVLFCAIASGAIGISTGGQFVNYVVVGYVYKCAIELLVMPVTVRIIAWLKNREPTYWNAAYEA